VERGSAPALDAARLEENARLFQREVVEREHPRERGEADVAPPPPRRRAPAGDDEETIAVDPREELLELRFVGGRAHGVVDDQHRPAARRRLGARVAAQARHRYAVLVTDGNELRHQAGLSNPCRAVDVNHLEWPALLLQRGFEERDDLAATSE
jgi:hypothetical protein